MAFPSPDEAAVAHSLHLIKQVRQLMADNDGWLSFQDYMDCVLYAPGLGYYSAGAHKIGAAGDFVTAPEISPLFGQCLARYAQSILAKVQQPIILELGAGLGTLAATMLNALAEQNALPEAYWILEPSPDLQRRQQQRLAEHCPQHVEKVHWLNELPTDSFNGLILGNEVIDALPVSRFAIRNGQAVEQGVIWQDNRFAWGDAPDTSEALIQAVNQLQSRLGPFSEGYQSEINLALPAWLQSVTALLNHGNLLWIDYGYPEHAYYHPQRQNGTLMCYYQHHGHEDPFVYPGLQDITASVDFSAVIRASETLGFELEDFSTQAQFLLDNGLTDCYQAALEQAPEQQAKLAQQVKALTLPDQMGETFKVVSFLRN